MADICGDDRFDLIDKYKQMLIDGTNIETAKDEMAVLDNIFFRLWQMGWLDELERMPLIKASAKTLIYYAGNSSSASAFRNAGRLIQNAIDGEYQEFEEIPVEPKRKKGKWLLADDGYFDFYLCSECGKQDDYKPNFCPECGSDMRGEKNG